MEFNLEAIAQSMSPAAMPPGKRRKMTILLILRNLGIIAFVFGFSYGYTLLFGSSNTVMGVCISTTIVTLWKVNMGMRAWQGSLVIFYIFLHIGLISHTVFTHPAIAIPVNIVSIYLILTLSGQQMQMKSYLPFATCYVFAEYAPVSGVDYQMRLLGLAVGGACTAIFYFVVHRKDGQTHSVWDVFRNIHFTSTRHRFIVRMTFGLTVAECIGQIFQLNKPIWIGMTVLSLTVPFLHEARSRMIQRVIGNLLGGLVFLLLFEALPEQYHMWALLATGFIYLFLTNYQWQQVFITINSLSGARVFYSADTALEVRLLLVLVGIAIVVAINLLEKLDLLDRIDIALRKWRRRRHYKQILREKNKQ